MSEPTDDPPAPAFPHGRPVATFWPRRGVYYDRDKPQPPIGGDPGHMSWTEAIAAGLAIADGPEGLMEALAAVDAAAYARAMAEKQAPPRERRENLFGTWDGKGEWCCRKHTPRPNFFTACNCGNKRCPHADDCAFVCTRSNEPDQIGVLTEPEASE